MHSISENAHKMPKNAKKTPKPKYSNKPTRHPPKWVVAGVYDMLASISLFSFCLRERGGGLSGGDNFVGKFSCLRKVANFFPGKIEGQHRARWGVREAVGAVGFPRVA